MQFILDLILDKYPEIKIEKINAKNEGYNNEIYEVINNKSDFIVPFNPVAV